LNLKKKKIFIFIIFHFIIIKANTLLELMRELTAAATTLKAHSGMLAVSSCCEIFTRFVTLISVDISVRNKKKRQT